VVAAALARITHSLLIGASADPEEEGQALEITESVDGVDRVTQLLTFHVGPDVVILSMKIAFRKAMVVNEIEDTINEIERRIRAEMTTMRKIFVEVDAHGDGRGIERARAAWAKRKLEEPRPGQVTEPAKSNTEAAE
jgi:divalent metal cation (Fe/Co/Zn/Cd) transporter